MRKWLFASFILYYNTSSLAKIAKSGQLPGSRQEVARKSRTSEVVSIVTGLVVGYLVLAARSFLLSVTEDASVLRTQWEERFHSNFN